MRTEIAVSRLIGASKDANVTAAELARQLSLMNRRVVETSRVGPEALEILKKDLLRDTLTKHVRIAATKTTGRKAAIKAKAKAKGRATPKAKASPKRRGSAKKVAA